MKSLKVTLALLLGLQLGAGYAGLNDEPWTLPLLILGAIFGVGVCAAVIFSRRRNVWQTVIFLQVPMLLLFVYNVTRFESEISIQVALGWAISVFGTLVGLCMVDARSSRAIRTFNQSG